ncbi:unnamed protein product [Effrenium voratum]|uniref:Uncharacterized protein n=1 Tax=Effrenium voratum TaxID=2562239 RepID=A0AA36HL99_9DINO|nr:unnamed protein product [Effrenium voratum]CAJ1460568.1 unnamed protein product [Effrenium voratum]
MSAAFPKEKAEEKPRKPRRPENDLQSFLGQENWRLRIRKERLHAAPLPEFSVKRAMRALDVPKKPCQVQPRWLDESSLEAEFRKELTVKRSPREHLLWPETSQHQVGWLVEDSLGLPMAQRPTLHGSPPKLGFGWHRRFADKDFEPMVPSPSTPSTASGSRRAAPAPAPAPQILEMPSPAEQTLPWFPGIGKLRRQRRLQRKQAREPEPRCELRPQSALVQPLGQCGDSRPPSALPGNSAGFRIAVQRPVEDEWLGRGNTPCLKPSTADHGVIDARSRECREFLRHGPKSHWARDKPVSDMSSFAHGYTMLWGGSFFGK